MTAADMGLRFWLRYVEATGGLTELAGETTLVMLPPALQTMLELPEVLQVTADPDVAREDGATFLSAGHPALVRSADEVLAVGDVAAMTVPVAATPPPPAAQLQAMARDQFSVEHGRIDATGAPTRSVRPILRVGALVDYTLSSDDHYQECAECWVDVQSQRQLPAPIGMTLAAIPAEPKRGPLSMTGLTTAVGVADSILERCATRRRSELGDGMDKARDAELERVEAYYRDALATIEHRRAQTPADRLELLDARANSVRSEHARRMGETREKYQARHQVRPYRLHICEVPVWRLPVDVRRGDRRYPLTLDWLIPLNRFVDIACPHCGAEEQLVAAKTRLGCACCVSRPTAQPASEPTTSPAKPAVKAKKPAVQPPSATKCPPSVRVVRSPRSVDVGKLGDKLITTMWEAVVRHDRRLERMCAPESPAAAAIRLYGPSGAARAVGIPPTGELITFAVRSVVASSGDRHASTGYVDTAAGHQYPFLIRWQRLGDAAHIDEILPYDRPFKSAHLSRWVPGPGRTGVHAPPQLRIPLHPVGELLWRHMIPTFGLPGTLRCLAALWRLPNADVLLDSHGSAAVAAGIERMVCQRANLTAGFFADIAAAYRVQETAVRAASADLQKCLRLGLERWW